MSYTAEQIADAVWAYSARTVDAGTPPDPDGSFLDSIAYQVWVYSTRTVEGGGTSHNLSSLPIGTIGSIGQSAIGQRHDLLSQSLGTLPSVGVVTFGQKHALLSGVIGAGIVSLGLSTIGQTATLSSVNLVLDQVDITECEIGEPGGNQFRRHRFNQGKGW